MKKKIITIGAAMMMLFATTFAQNTNHGINGKVAAAFSREFAKATNVSWQSTDAYYKAAFEWNGQNLAAFFTKEGDIMGIVHNILSTALPINLRASLDEKYSAFWISELYELAKDGATRYYATVENADQKIIIESVDTYDWSTFQNTSKRT